jgi:type I restriction enzyme M protein
MTFLQRAIQEGQAKFIGDGKNQQIHYIAANHKERFSDPEEPVRAEF